MTQILLDTGLLIQHLRGKRRTVQMIRLLTRTDHLAISVISRYELFAGMFPSETIATRRLLSRVDAYPVTDAIAERAGILANRLRQYSFTVDPPDILIAATAIIHNIPLATLNRKHFEIVLGLRLYPLDIDE